MGPSRDETERSVGVTEDPRFKLPPESPPKSETMKENPKSKSPKNKNKSPSNKGKKAHETRGVKVSTVRRKDDWNEYYPMEYTRIE